MARLQLEDLSKTYSPGPPAVQGLTLDVADGELVVMVGPSGCGKSTVLRMVAGLETPTRGRIRIGEREVTHLDPRHRDLAMVFQSYALYPHKNVRENLGFGLRMRRVSRTETRQRVERVAAGLGLTALLERRPAELSGGQRQRVALGRAIVREPQAFLLDEPLSNLDAQLRAETRAELARMHQGLGATMLYVTHDQEEAMTLGDRIAVLRDGRLQQAATPREVYRRPANAFVAGFIGSPAMNLLGGHVRHGRDGVRLKGAGFDFAAGHAPRLEDGRGVLLGFRPEDLRPAAPDQADLRCVVEVVEMLGATLLVHARLDGGPHVVRATLPATTRIASGDALGLVLDPDALHVFDAGTGARCEMAS